MRQFRRIKTFPALLVLSGCALLGACASPTPPASLFDRLGGLPAITAVADKTVERSASDPRTRRSFEGVKLAGVKKGLTTQICEATGGPCKYEGDSMAQVHKGLDITAAEFDALVEQLVDTLNQFKVPAREKNELLQLLGPMKSDIVTK